MEEVEFFIEWQTEPRSSGRIFWEAKGGFHENPTLDQFGHQKLWQEAFLEHLLEETYTYHQNNFKLVKNHFRKRNEQTQHQHDCHAQMTPAR